MNLSLHSNEDDRVALAHATHTIRGLTQACDFLENAGFHMLEATKKLNGTDTYCHQIPLNLSLLFLYNRYKYIHLSLCMDTGINEFF